LGDVRAARGDLARNAEVDYVQLLRRRVRKRQLWQAQSLAAWERAL
jgi:hypothetical protein